MSDKGLYKIIDGLVVWGGKNLFFSLYSRSYAAKHMDVPGADCDQWECMVDAPASRNAGAFLYELPRTAW